MECVVIHFEVTYEHLAIASSRPYMHGKYSPQKSIVISSSAIDATTHADVVIAASQLSF